MTPRSLVVLLLLAATPIPSEQGEIGTWPTKELSGRALKEFLGPVSPSLATWHRIIGSDEETYYGRANPPLSGDIDISLQSERWWVDLGTQPTPGGPDRLGTLAGEWSTYQDDDGTHYRGFRFADATGYWMTVRVFSKIETNVDALAAETSRLPMFNERAEHLFRGIRIRRSVAQWVVWVAFPAAFFAAICVLLRRLQRRKASLLRWACTIGAISAGWVPLFLGLLFLMRAAWVFHWPFFGIADCIQSEFREGAATLNLAIPSAFFVGAFLIIVFVLLQRLIRPRSLRA